MIRLYGLLLRLYPPGFRQTFAAEMLDVFTEALAAASQRGRGAVVALWLRELRDFPLSLLRAHRHEKGQRMKRRKHDFRPLIGIAVASVVIAAALSIERWLSDHAAEQRPVDQPNRDDPVSTSCPLRAGR
ncbi:MAG: hypothetical protein GYB67_07335 [Chloroflexi bacterium]|nr:hypothetical protein [Chloroflexota bacterium]